MFFDPFFAGFFPGEVVAFFSFDPFILTDLLFHDVGHPIEGVFHHHWWNGDVVFALEDFTHGGRGGGGGMCYCGS